MRLEQRLPTCFLSESSKLCFSAAPGKSSPVSNFQEMDSSIQHDVMLFSKEVCRNSAGAQNSGKIGHQRQADCEVSQKLVIQEWRAKKSLSVTASEGHVPVQCCDFVAKHDTLSVLWCLNFKFLHDLQGGLCVAVPSLSMPAQVHNFLMLNSIQESPNMPNSTP